MWRQVWRQIPHNSLKFYWNNAWMPRNDHSELKICTLMYCHPRNTMVSHYSNILTNSKGYVWRQIWRQIPQFCPKLYLNNAWMSTNWAKIYDSYILSNTEQDGVAKILIFWLFKGYNVIMTSNMMWYLILACQQIVLFTIN